VLRRIAFIVFAQRIGMTLDEVSAELAKLPENRVPEAGNLELNSCSRNSLATGLGKEH
jgi:hypothetical protein